VRDASARIDAGYLEEHGVDDLALALGAEPNVAAARA
jgi:hypothetical protein